MKRDKADEAERIAEGLIASAQTHAWTWDKLRCEIAQTIRRAPPPPRKKKGKGKR